MALRLSSSSSNGAASSADSYIQKIKEDTALSLTQKHDCLKTLAVVLKNLVGVQKGAGPDIEAGLKYRTLKLDNPKLKARLFCASGVRELFLEHVGMVADGNTLVLWEVPSEGLRETILLKILPAVTVAQLEIANNLDSSPSSSKKAKLTEHNNNNNNNGGRVAVAPLEKLSEKQKARLLMEEKQQRERDREKAFRKETRAKIAADKLVRQTDENWKPSVSAAADKTGTGLLTFRDRHGE